MSKRLNTLDLFAGCGGLCDGFESSHRYSVAASVEWEKAPRDTLANRLKTRWGVEDSERRTILFDLQRTSELFSGWKNDPVYGSGEGLDSLLSGETIDVVIGGPPCQAYSIAGRIRDKDGMASDYRNYLFESYLKVIQRYKPKAFIFENVPGLLSAKPQGELIAPRIQSEFMKAGWAVAGDLRSTLVDMSDYGVPQVRKRLIILGLSIDCFGESAKEMIRTFYEEILPSKKTRKVSVGEAIGDLPKLYPLKYPSRTTGSHSRHSSILCPTDHDPRYHNPRDVGTFRILSEDALSENVYSSAEMLKEFYKQRTGKNSAIHKYHVLRSDKPSNLIPAHLMKDGLRHIHPDPVQARSITVREAARLQGFPDDYEFLGSKGDKYRMIGNAVPPSFSRIVAESLAELLDGYAALNRD